MAYIGNTPAEKYVSLTAQHFTVTATASYVLTSSVTNENGIALFINNVRQEPGASYAYTAAGTTLTLSAATAATDTMYCVYLGKAVGTIAPPDGSVNSAKIVDGSITSDDLAGSIANAKITDLAGNKLTGTVTAKGDGASAVGKLLINCEQNTHGVTIQSPVHSSGGNYTLTLPINDGDANDFLQSNGSGVLSWTAVPPTDTSQLEMNQALLAFKIAASNQLAKFQMVDQVIDEYQDATGVDAGASTNELADGATTAKYYHGGTSTTPTITENSDSDGTDGDYTWYQWNSGSSGSFESSTTQNVEVLVVAGGGAGGNGGGGAGGYRTNVAYAVTASTAIGSITVGGGGAVGGSNGASGGNGGNSIFGTITSTGGGGGGGYGVTTAGSAGGSGGGGNALSGNNAGGAGNAGSFSPVEGYAGGAGSTDAVTWTGGGGGGGASSVGLQPVDSTRNNTTVTGNNGGAGTANDITGTSLFYAGGGGGGYDGATASGGIGGSSVGGNGGQASTSASAATANRGGGGGGDSNYAGRTAGAAGVVVVRVLTSTLVAGGNLTLQSVATTAASAPTTGDLVVLIDDGGSGTSAVQTNIKGFISRNGNFATLDTDHKQVTFVDEGTWGTTKQKILVARNVDLSGITTGTSMKYRLTTHSQSAGTMETRIHATSLAWA